MNGGPLSLQKGVVYGPVMSRRLGNSLGINLSPDEIKLCSLNCSYCQYSWTGLLVRDASQFRHLLPMPGTVAAEVGKALSRAAVQKIRVDSITFSGNGEPTVHTDFPEIVDAVIALRDSLAPEARVVCLSNSTTLGDAGILTALKRLDEPVMKLDTGDKEIFRRLNRPAKEISFDGILEGLAKFNGALTIQTLFVRGSVDNTTDEALGSYISAVSRIKPRALQIYTLDRVPADRSLIPVTKDKLDDIKKLIEREANLPAVVYF